MRVVTGRDALTQASFRRPVVAIGVFDGVHRGHRHVLESLRAFADEADGEAVVVTFDTHPRALLDGRAPRPLVSLAHRLLLLSRLGLDAVVVLPFDAAMRDTPFDAFVADVLVGRIGVRGLLFGYDTCFGRDGLGTFDTVAPLALRHGFAVRRAPPIAVGGRPISATRIREALERGDLEAAAELLGRPPTLYGPVVHGDGRGRTLGFPTANVDLEGESLPPAGVYQVVATLRGRRYAAVANIGTRPTFPDARPARPLLEVHVPGVDFAFYGEPLEVELVRKIRDEQRFPNRDALVAQIRRDVASLALPAADDPAGGPTDR
ncbi:MAG: riboflavin biosynthesis protein RibF [Planctomycetota bacterium]